MTLRNTLLLINLLLLLAHPGLGQERNQEKITGIFAGITFERFANQIENSTNYRIFFSPRDVQDLVVNVSAKENTIQQVLEGVLEQTDLKFSIDSQNRVFITRLQKLDFNFSSGFFDANRQSDGADSAGRTQDVDRVFSRNKLYQIGNPGNLSSAEAILSGMITGLETGDPMAGALVFEKVNYTRAISNQDGAYSIRLPKGRHTIFIQNLGGFIEQRQINLIGDGVLDIAIEENIMSLSEFVLSSEKMTNISRPEMGVQKLSMNNMKKIPAVLGEVDVIRSILTLPGVQTVGEASVGFNVRGGAADQNLILFNHATIYNPSHLFGLFSAFNPDVVESVDLYKAGIPVQYGGRLSSVLDVNAKYGNSEKIKVSGGIGLMTGRLTIDGPIGEKTKFLLGGRSTYSNWLFDLLEQNTDFNEGRAAFYDLNFNLSHQIDNKNILYLNAYNSKDNFRFDRDTLFTYENVNFNIGWTHYFSDDLEAQIFVGRDRYNFGIEGRDNPFNAYNFGFNVQQDFAKANFTYAYSEQHKFHFGFNSIRYRLKPGSLAPFGETSIVVPEQVRQEQALETAIFFGDDFEINEKLSLNLGFRYALYQFLGPNVQRDYQVGEPITSTTLIRETNFDKGKVINSYHGPEFRISGRYILNNQSSIKAGYNTNRQFIHLLTSNSAIAPTDTWKLSDPNIRPQWGDQLSLGYYRNMKGDKYEFSLETYHRSMRNMFDFKSGATLVLNNSIEQQILRTKGRTYGAEVMLKKNTGKLNGWVSYTYSRSLLQTDPKEAGEKINGGNWYASNFDQPHNAVLVGNYELSKRFSTSINASYNTGRPITLPVAKFEYGGSERVYFSDRNAYRIPDYFRLDASINLEGNHKVQKLAHSSWSLGVYNVLGRNNPYSVFFTPVDGRLQGYQLSIFARPIPFITYNFRF
jgi:hypothetical protein